MAPGGHFLPFSVTMRPSHPLLDRFGKRTTSFAIRVVQTNDLPPGGVTECQFGGARLVGHLVCAQTGPGLVESGKNLSGAHDVSALQGLEAAPHLGGSPVFD